MAALVQQLEQLKKHQEELEKRIQEEAEIKKKLNNAASIERLEALVEPMTEDLDFVDLNNHNMHSLRNGHNKSQRIISTEKFVRDTLVYNSNMQNAVTKNGPYPRPIRRGNGLENEEIFVTLIGILKKQEKRIEYLESIIIKDN